MNKSQKAILSVLRKKSASMRVLEKDTGYSYDGIRGRISELRKMGFDISYDGKKYLLSNEQQKNVYETVSSTLKKNNLFNVPILITQIEYHTGLKKEELMPLFVELSKKEKLVQLSQNKLIIYPF